MTTSFIMCENNQSVNKMLFDGRFLKQIKNVFNLPFIILSGIVKLMANPAPMNATQWQTLCKFVHFFTIKYRSASEN